MIKSDMKFSKSVETKHIPVLLNEIIENLNLKKGDIVIDGTLGGGGYAKEICKIIGKDGLLIGFDQDVDAVKRVERRLEDCKDCLCKKKLINENFRNLDKGANLEFQGIVFDLGLSSDQFELSGRGFTFQKDEPLLMTFGKKLEDTKFTAKEIVNDWDEENIADILFGYGGEKFSRRIAKKIVEARKEKPIKTTFELVEIIKKAVPSWYKVGRKTHFATKTFQALRIAVNDELGALKEGLEKGFNVLSKGGRMAVVSFHSDEDRVVKRFMRNKKEKGVGILLTKKPIIPSREESVKNPRSRSAKLRVIEKI